MASDSTEAAKIKVKHLCTLEPGISVDQTDEMSHQGVHLVIPESLLQTYAPAQLLEIWNLNRFVEFVRSKQ